MSYSYQEELPAEAAVRYKKKLDLVGLDQCPFKYSGDTWINNPNQWPEIMYHDVYNYLIKFPGVFSGEAMDNFRSLEAYKFFVSGWVQTVFHMRLSGNIVFKADVKPSYRVNDEPHHPWVALKTSGQVIAAHCDCMAGYVFYINAQMNVK